MRFLLLHCLLQTCLLCSAQDSNHIAFLANKEITKNANAIVKLHEMIVELPSLNEMTISRKRVVTVLNKQGNRHTRTRIGYNRSIKVKEVHAVIYDAFGKEIQKFKEKDFRDIGAVDGGTLYSDSRILYLDYTPVQYPYTIEFTYRITTDNTATIPSWYFIDDFSVSTVKSRYEVIYGHPEQRPVIVERNMEGIVVSKSESGESVTYEAINIPAIKEESLSPDLVKIAPHLMVRLENFQYEGYTAHIKNWNDVGLWMHHNLLQGRDELPEATQRMAQTLVAGVTDTLEKAKIIYDYVQRNTRYISVQVGIGGLQPISAREVDRVKYGDCKGLSNYTKALMESVGVTAYYTHVQAGMNKVDFEEEFADLGQGNHVILAVPYRDQYYWIDCTSQTLPFGFVGDFTDDRKVLVIKPEGSEIVSTPAYIDSGNYQQTKALYSLDDSGAITGRVERETKGIQYDRRFYLEKRTSDEIENYYKNYWGNINNLKLLTTQFDNNKDEVHFRETVDLEAANYASVTGDRMLFTPNAFNRNSFVPNRYRQRKLPFEIPRGFRDEDEFLITLPQGYGIEGKLPETSIETEFGSYQIAMAYDAPTHTIRYERSLQVHNGNYSRDKYDAYRAFRKEVAQWDNAQVVILESK